MSDEEKAILPETRESKRALQIKSSILGMLTDVVEVMEQARAEGFEVQFSILRNPETAANYITADLVKVIKSW